MPTVLQHRKARRRLIADSRGFSSIVGAVFAVLVIISLTATVFIWSISQNNLYNNAVRTKNQLDAEQSSEKINAFNASYVVSGNTVSVSAPIQNLGYLPLQITRIWLRDINVTGLYNVSALLTDYSNITAGAPATIMANILMTGVQANHNFTSWLVTGRGNVFATSTSLMGPAGSQGSQGPTGPPGPPGPPSESALVAQGIGSISMDFKKFYHCHPANTNNGTDIGSPDYGYTIPNTYTIIHLSLTNLDITKKTIYLSNFSYLWAASFFSSTVKSDSWWIMNVTNNKIITSFTALPLVYNQTTDVYFGPNPANWVRGNVAPINILLFGKLGSGAGAQDYGQNLPFIALNFL